MNFEISRCVGCENCGKITTSVKRMDICFNTIFNHQCSWINACLECRIVTQICIEEYDRLTNFLKQQVQDFSLRITKDMRLNCR